MKKNEALSLLIAVCVIATCGLIYELVAGTLASYLLGDTITQFSTIIGTYLFAMGIGSYASKYIHNNLLDKFIIIEYLVGIIGGFSATLLFYLFNEVQSFEIVLYALVFITGALVGLEIPLLIHILNNKIEFKNLVARVFTFDYMGALIASFVFPLLFVPKLGLLKTAAFFGLLNIATGIIICYLLEKQIHNPRKLKAMGFLCTAALLACFVFSDKILSTAESKAYPGRVIYAATSPYQRIVVTRQGKDLRLFLNNNLQFSTVDEHRYHEALVHPTMQRAATINNILVLGGGDGLAVREILKYDNVKKIDLVDLDPEMTKMFTSHPVLVQLNKNALINKKVTVTNTDAFTWVKKTSTKYDVVIIDFPDPSNYSLGKLYTNTFYNYLANIMHDSSVAVIQSTSPFVAKNSFWCVNKTLNHVGFNTVPYYNDVPSFGVWGYIMATKKTSLTTQRQLPTNLRFLTDSSMAVMQHFGKDMLPQQELEVNKLNNQSLVHYFEKEWSSYLHN